MYVLYFDQRKRSPQTGFAKVQRRNAKDEGKEKTDGYQYDSPG